MNASLPPTDAEVAKATLQREEQQRLAMRERMFLWREAVSDCLAVAVSYAQMAQLAAGVEDDLAFNHGLKNFFCAAREASSIYRDFRPRAPWETGANA